MRLRPWLGPTRMPFQPPQPANCLGETPAPRFHLFPCPLYATPRLLEIGSRDRVTFDTAQWLATRGEPKTGSAPEDQKTITGYLGRMRPTRPQDAQGCDMIQWKSFRQVSVWAF